jgi:spermidine/putrescine transport system substrate-binding protein
MLCDYIWYITPVPEVKGIFEKYIAEGESPKYYRSLATSPLIFPSESDFRKLHRYRTLTNDEEQVWNDLFQPIYQA